MFGKVIAISCGTYHVLAEGAIYKVPARGLFRHKNIKPIVGDNVILDETTFVIDAIDQRKNVLKRPVISNIDQIFIIVSLRKPLFSYELAFKYLTYINSNNINAKIILTKTDLVEDKKEIQEIVNNFHLLGVETHLVSSVTLEGIEELKEICKGKITCLMGQSGSGKSSLINAIDPNYKRDIGEYSFALGRGKHETKEVILLPYNDGFIADTPGFSSLDLNLSKEDLAKFFPKFNTLYTKCYYSNCLHLTENKCAVKEAIENKEIPEVAYSCYKKLIELSK